MTKAASAGHHLIGILTSPARLLERSRGRKRLALVVLYLLIAAVVGIFAWREASLNGLPDVGDPFDVRAFQTERVDAAKDAYPLYQQAMKRSKPLPGRLREGSNRLVKLLDEGDPPDTPEFHEWSRENAEALEIWRRATEMPDVNWPSGSQARWDVLEPLREFSWLAAEKARLAERQADRAEAWKWRKAILRSYRHSVRRGPFVTRVIAPRVTAAISARLLPISAEVDDDLLRRMLADLKAIDAMTPPNSETIKGEYLNLLDYLPQIAFEPPSIGTDPTPGWYEFNPGYLQARKFLRHEPERSRRLLQIVAANQLAYADLPSHVRPPTVPPGFFDATKDPSAPRSARLLDPRMAVKWAESTVLQQGAIGGLHGCIEHGDRDRRGIENLLLEVARELYRRDHDGAEPASDATLVGPYLDRLPELSAAVGVTMP